MKFRVSWDCSDLLRLRKVVVEMLDDSGTTVMKTRMFPDLLLRFRLPVRKWWMAWKYAEIVAASDK